MLAKKKYFARIQGYFEWLSMEKEPQWTILTNHTLSLCSRLQTTKWIRVKDVKISDFWCLSEQNLGLPFHKKIKLLFSISHSFQHFELYHLSASITHFHLIHTVPYISFINTSLSIEKLHWAAQRSEQAMNGTAAPFPRDCMASSSRKDS